ncbi:MAG TPA: hypothetical protein VHO70_22260 [Chitinispirillaceae bacterium]|nr:hypothetical protein [Chitinispirillaceae bacterium]
MGKKYSAILITGVIAAVLFHSCASRSALRQDNLANAALSGDYLSAVKKIQKKTQLYGKLNQFLYNMDIGVLFHYAQVYDSSNVYLLRAADIFQELFARSITNEAAAVLTNDNVRPYRSRPYELAMLHQLIAFNFQALGSNDEALVETRRAQLLFNEWERKDKSGNKFTNDPMFHYTSSIAYDAAGEFDNAMISLYKAVEAFQKGPLTLPEPVKNYAYYQFKKNDRDDDNSRLKLNATLPESSVDGVGNEFSEIILIGYAGKGPALNEQTWWGTWIKDGLLVVNHTDENGKMHTMTLPAPPLPESELRKAEKGQRTESGTTFHIKFALPAVKTFPSQTDHFIVRGDKIGKQFQSVVINDLDKQLEKNLEDTRAATMTRTVIRVVLRTIAAQQAKNQIQTNNGVANLLLNVGTDLLTDQLEHADARNCFLVPKQVHIARIPVKPGTYSVSVDAVDFRGVVLGTKSFDAIAVKNREKKFIFYPSLK